MAGVVVLDASVLIAYLDQHDAHHRAALDLLDQHADRRLAVSPVTLGEALVGPVRAGIADQVRSEVADLGVGEASLPNDAAIRLAALRVTTGLRMPDCGVLLAAESADAAVATFDDKLARAAARRGLEAVPERAGDG